MSKKNFPSDVIEQATDVLAGWKQIGSAVAFGTLTSAALTTDVNALAPLEAEIQQIQKQLDDKRNQRDVLCVTIWDKVKRVRANVKGTYGDDSQQYEFVGGTRTSERKPRTRKTVAA